MYVAAAGKGGSLQQRATQRAAKEHPKEKTLHILALL